MPVSGEMQFCIKFMANTTRWVLKKECLKGEMEWFYRESEGSICSTENGWYVELTARGGWGGRFIHCI